MRQSRCLQGVGVGDRVAIGAPLRVLEASLEPASDARSPAENTERLRDAMSAVSRRLRERMAASDDTTAAILEFQAEMLDDPGLGETLWPAIADGQAAHLAWGRSMAELIEPFDNDDDDYFRARAADLRDLRDSVMDMLVDGDLPAHVRGGIVVANDLGPSRFLDLVEQGAAGFVLGEGSATSHVAILARARGIPLVIGAATIAELVEVQELGIDAGAGTVWIDPAPDMRETLLARGDRQRAAHERGLASLNEPAFFGGERVFSMVNIDDPTTIDPGLLAKSDGIGLWRTEFMFLGREAPPSEDEQYAVMAAVCRRLAGRPVTIRSLDIGGDKPLPYLNLPAESNPYLGLRGLRLCLAHPGIWEGQLRAILRLAADYPVKLMLPMVTLPRELNQAREAIKGIAEGMPGAVLPEIGIMVETPASAIACDLFDAEFFSIGSNDLTQYVMAASRDAGGAVAALANPLEPAVMRLITSVIAYGRSSGRPVSVCGDMAADAIAARRLLDVGLRQFSVGQAALPMLRTVIADHRPGHGG